MDHAPGSPSNGDGSSRSSSLSGNRSDKLQLIMEQNDQIRERARDLRQASTHPRHSRGARLQGLGTSCTWCSSKCEEQCFSKGCGKQAHRSCWQDASSELALLGPAIVLCPECAVKAIDGSLDRTHVRDHVHTLQEMKIRCYQVNVRPCHSSGTSSSWTSSGDGRVSASKSERQQSALCSAYPQPILSLPSAYPLILSHPARGDGGGGDAAAGELGGEFARGLSTAPGGLPCRFRRRRRRPSLPAAYHQPTLRLTACRCSQARHGRPGDLCHGMPDLGWHLAHPAGRSDSPAACSYSGFQSCDGSLSACGCSGFPGCAGSPAVCRGSGSSGCTGSPAVCRGSGSSGCTGSPAVCIGSGQHD